MGDKIVHVKDGAAIGAPVTLTLDDTPRIGESVAIPDRNGDVTVREVLDILHVPAEVDNGMPAFTVIEVDGKHAEEHAAGSIVPMRSK